MFTSQYYLKLKGKHCQKPHCRNQVVHHLGLNGLKSKSFRILGRAEAVFKLAKNTFVSGIFLVPFYASRARMKRACTEGRCSRVSFRDIYPMRNEVKTFTNSYKGFPNKVISIDEDPTYPILCHVTSGEFVLPTQISTVRFFCVTRFFPIKPQRILLQDQNIWRWQNVRSPRTMDTQ